MGEGYLAQQMRKRVEEALAVAKRTIDDCDSKAETFQMLYDMTHKGKEQTEQIKSFAGSSFTKEEKQVYDNAGHVSAKKAEDYSSLSDQLRKFREVIVGAPIYRREKGELKKIGSLAESIAKKMIDVGDYKGDAKTYTYVANITKVLRGEKPKLPNEGIRVKKIPKHTSTPA